MHYHKSMLVQVKVVKVLFKGKPSSLVLLRDVTHQVRFYNSVVPQQLRDRILNSITQNFLDPLYIAQTCLTSSWQHLNQFVIKNFDPNVLKIDQFLEPIRISINVMSS